MHYQSLDAYFYLAAKGDEYAYYHLYEGFVSWCHFSIKSSIQKTSNFTGFSEDFSDIIDILFFKTIRDYDEERGSFTFFASYTIKTRLIPKVLDAIAIIQNKHSDIDPLLNNNHTFEDVLADPNQKSILEEIIMNDFKCKISSPGTRKSKDNKEIDRILLLQFGGFKNSEICKHLKCTYSQLRRYLEKIKKDDYLINFKIELK